MTGDGLTVPANNIVRLTSNNVILLILTGQQTKESVDKVYRELSTVIQDLKSKQKPVLIMTDIDHMIHSPKAEEAQKEAIKVLGLPFDAMAICYGGPANIKLAQELTKRASVEELVRTFDNTNDAAAWLAKILSQKSKK